MLEFGLPILLYALSFIISVVIGVYTFQNRQIRGTFTFAIYAFCQAQWTLGYIFELSAPTLEAKIFWDNFQYLGSFLVPVSIVIFALAYTTTITDKQLVALAVGLSIFPIVGTILAFTNDLHGLVAIDYRLLEYPPFNALYYDLGMALGLLAMYSYALSFAGVTLLLNYNRKVKDLLRTQLWFILIGLIIPLFTSFSFIFDITLNGQRDFQPITFGIGNIFVAIGLFRYRFFSLVPVARERVLQAMNDAVIVIDNDQRILDINPRAQAMFFSEIAALGKFLSDVLSWLAPHITTHSIQKELQILNGDKQSYYELTTSEILDEANQRSGTLIIIRDVTDKIMALRAIEDARFQAELLADISDAMNSAQSEDDLLVAFSAILVQHMPTRTALMYVDYEDGEVTQLRTVALQNDKGENIPLSTFNRLLNYTPEEFPLINKILNTDFPLYIENVHKTNLLGEIEMDVVNKVGFSAMIIIPLRTQERHEAFMVINWRDYHIFPESLRTMIELLSPRLAENITARRATLQVLEAQKETEMFYRLSQEINGAVTYTQILDAFANVFGPFDFMTTLLVPDHFDFKTAKQATVVAILIPGEKTSDATDTLVPLLRTETYEKHMLLIEDTNSAFVENKADTELYKSFGIQSILIADCVLGERVIGRLNFSSPTLYHFTPFDKRLIRGLSDLVAAALERSRLYDEQVKIADQLRAVDQMKSQFLASMSHELRTPLNAILNFTEFVSLGMLGVVNDKQKDALGKSLDSAKHLLSLINDVLDMTKIEAGMMKLFIEENIDLTNELNTIIATGKTLLQDKPVTLIQDVDADLPLIVGDKRRIRQILLNLLSNACKFTEKGSVTLSVKKRQEELLFAVIDTGPGISPDDQEIIFEPFRQTEHGIRHAGGTGLGLPITKKLVEAHGGKLWLESDAGQGASFYLTLPIRSEVLVLEMQQSFAISTNR